MSQHELFTNQLGAMVEQLDRRSIDYRAIGSVAAAALHIIPLDMRHRDAIDPIDTIPDLDVIVPRSDLAGAREVREVFANDSYPLKLGLAIPSMQVDLQPSDDQSLLSWGKHRLPVETAVSDAHRGHINDVSIRTVSAETLRHFYSSLSPQGQAGEKYVRKLRMFDDVLGPDDDHAIGDPYNAFHEYGKLMGQYTPLSRRSMELFGQVTAHMTPEQRQRLRRVAFKLAGVAGWR